MSSTDEFPTNVVADVLRVLFKRKRTIVAFLLATVATVLVASFLFFDLVYSATSQILIQRGREHILDVTLPTTGAVRPVMNFNQEQQIALATEIMQGRSLLAAVVGEIGHENIYPAEPTGRDEIETPVERTIHKLHDEIKVERIYNAALLNVSFEHQDPVVAANVVNTLVRLYLDRHIEVQRNAELKDFFAQQFEELNARQKVNERMLAEFKETHGISTSLSDKRGFLIEQQMALQAEAKQSAIEVEGVRRSLSQIRRQLAARDNGQIMSVKLYEDLYSQQLQQEVALRAIQAKLNTQNTQLANYDESIESIDGIDAEFDRLQEQVSVGKEAYRLYLAKFEESKISEAMDREGIVSIKVVEPAYVPTRPVPNHLALALPLALLLGSIGGVTLAFLLEKLSGTIDAPSDVERLLQLPVLAAVPHTSGS